MTLQAYADFLEKKRIVDPMTGIADCPALPDFLFPHQRAIVSWALRRGRAAVFAGTGLGKTLIELVWAQAVARHTGRPVILFAPLAVSHQHAREAAGFGLAAKIVEARGDGDVDITNYQKIDRFDLAAFAGVALDESSILKSHDGHFRTRLIEACRAIPFRLAATATPAPNDFTELGNHAEFLGVMSMTDMLACFFTHDSSETQTWRLKGHAEEAFWRWMASWSVMLRKPSDLGFPDEGYDLPPLRRVEHKIAHDGGFTPDGAGQMSFLPPVARSLKDRLAARRNSISRRIDVAAALTPSDRPFVWWCSLNEESEGLARAIPGAVEVRGSDRDADKERKLVEFSEGRIRVLVTKPSIAGFGMNWQHCADTGFVGLTDSFEQIYQATRRFWRFGQTKPVTAHYVYAEAEGAVLANLDRKEREAERMADGMVRAMAGFSAEAVRGLVRDEAVYQPRQSLALPRWEEFA